ncbi:MAG TPA: endonuclease MutS2, partial [Clostridia bacterium]|nr:endonuclease MutS2 [Clostridia bacterium]
MNDISSVLEFDKIRSMLSERASSTLGSQMCKNLSPSTDYAEIVSRQDQTDEAEAVLYRLGKSPIDAFDNIYPHIKKAEKNSILGLKELLDTARFLRAVQNTKKHLTPDDKFPILTAYSSGLLVEPDLESDISSMILSEDEVSDNATPELASIRTRIRAANNKIRDLLQKYIRSEQYSKYLQEALVTIRNDRFVLPVKSEYRAAIPGLIHDQSASGATVFIEPLAAVEANNEIKQLIGEEKKEIERIQAELTARVKEICPQLKTDLEIMAELDFIFARAKLSRDLFAVRPKINTQGRIDIRQARHPLIPKDVVVPIDIALGDSYCLLLITGPNTGGKTVALKTVGLFILMAQSGLHVPAVSADISVFTGVFADIGDAQSIEQSLSTFSAHLTNIARILSKANEKSLVLLDEIGVGTDPDEGSALAMAILDYLRERGIRTIATTHYSELKAYAAVTENAQNASVEFDVETLSPTYKLLIGVPGTS